MVIDQVLIEEPSPSAVPVLEMVESTGNFGKIVVEPLERGFGVTLGNALRRVLLSSLPGAAITSIRIDGVQHEYTTIPMMKEDVSEFILNIKGVRIKAYSDRPGPLRLEVQGPGEISAGDIQPSADFEIVNPELYLATLDSAEARFVADFNVEIGKGYVQATHPEDGQIGMLPVDAIFSPVTRANYTVEKTRVGQVTDFDKLVLEVWTDGTKSANACVREAAQIIVDSFFQFAHLDSGAEGMPNRQGLAHALPADQYNMPIERLGLSARTLNCLKRAKVNRVGEVVEKTRSELLKIKNFGDKSLTELYDRLQVLGLLDKVEGAGQSAAAPEPPVAVAAVVEEPLSSPVAAEEPEEAVEEASAEAEKAKTPPAKETIRDLSALRALLNERDGEEDPDGQADTEEGPAE
jgi:DNA-directed RNA polymerase subunit alpha